MRRKNPTTTAPVIAKSLSELHPEAMVPPTIAGPLLGIATTHLEAGRLRHTLKLPFYRIGNSVRYKVGDLIAFRDKCRVEPSNTK